MSKKLKKRLIKIVIAGVLFAILMVIAHTCEGFEDSVIALVLFLALYLYIGLDVLRKAWLGVVHGHMMDENFLMMIASVGAFFIGSYSEGVAVILFYQIGEWFQSYAVGKSRNSIKELMNIRPDYAVVLKDGQEITVSPEEVKVDDIIVIKPGERVPLDCRIVAGESSLDTMALTGESVPRDISVDDNIISGCVNLSGLIQAKVTKTYGESTVSKILSMVENAPDKKSESENFITRFAKYYTPFIVVSASILAIAPPLITGGEWIKWLYRALSFLVISCPCALVISIPLGFFGGIGGASKEGILVKGSLFLERLSNAEIVAMDKTGTITKGIFSVREVVVTGKSTKDKVIELAALAESHSTHPIARSLMSAYGKEPDRSRITEVKEYAGSGVAATIDGEVYLAGNDKLMRQNNIEIPDMEKTGTVVFLGKGEELLGYLVIRDEEKEDAAYCVSELKRLGVQRVVMLTGDREQTAKFIADRVGITEFVARCLPADKVNAVERLLNAKSAKGRVVFVGDGINDAPVLTKADIGIAMGGMGSDAAIEAADIVIMTDEPAKIAKAVKIARKTLTIVKENIVFALGIKLLILILAAVGIATMWGAVFADVGVAFLAILNSMRAMNAPK